MAHGEGGGGVLREILASFGFDVDVHEIERGESKLGEFLEKVKHVGEAILAAFAVEQIYEFAESQAKAMNAIERTGQQLGITADRVQEFQFAARSLGLEADSLLNLMGRPQVTQQQGAQAGTTQAKAFAALGVSVKDAGGHMKAADELMLDVADGIKNIEDPSKRAASAVELFGRSGRELLPFLENGRAGAEEYFEAFRQAGGGYTEDAMKAGKDFDKQQAKTGLAMTALKGTIAKALLPVITALSKGFAAVVSWFNRMAKDSNIVQAALITLGAAGAAFAVNMAVASAPLILMAAALAGIVLAIDDVYTFFNGGDSLIGRAIDKIFGKDAHEDLLKWIKDAKGLKDTWHDIKDTFSELWREVKPVWEAFKWMVEKADKLGGIIGNWAGKTDFKEGGLKYEQVKQYAAQNRSGNSYEQNVAKRQAELWIDAEKQGKTFTLTEIPKSFKGFEKDFARDVAVWRNHLRGAEVVPGQVGPVNQYNAELPGLPQPRLPPPNVASAPSHGNSADVHHDVQVTVKPSSEFHATVEQTAKRVHKQRNREAAATVPRAGT